LDESTTIRPKSPALLSQGYIDRVPVLQALTLEAVQIAAELGADVNAVNTDGRTALDAAKALRYDSVVKFLVQKGAKSGRPIRQEAPKEVSDK